MHGFISSAQAAFIDQPPGWSREETGMAGPDAPDSLSKVSATSDTMNLAWTAVVGADSYRIEARVAGVGSWVVKSAVETGTTATIVDLEADVTYDVRIRTTVGAQVSSWRVLSGVSTLPGAPADLTFVSRTTSSITVDLTQYGARTVYEISVNDGAFTYTGAVGSNTLTGLTSGTQYAIKVRVSSPALGDWSNAVNMRTQPATVGASLVATPLADGAWVQVALSDMGDCDEWLAWALNGGGSSNIGDQTWQSIGSSPITAWPNAAGAQSYHVFVKGRANSIESETVDVGYCVVWPATGYLLSTYCDGTTLMGTYADGSGGVYAATIEENSTECGA